VSDVASIALYSIKRGDEGNADMDERWKIRSGSLHADVGVDVRYRQS
jgi:hypothetical protein